MYCKTEDDLSHVDAGKTYKIADCARFPIQETFRCKTALCLLRSLPHLDGEERLDALVQLGELMYQSHAEYGLIGLGDPSTDRIVANLREMGVGEGVYGARVSGGGSGGTVVILCSIAALPRIEDLAAKTTPSFSGLIR